MDAEVEAGPTSLDHTRPLTFVHKSEVRTYTDTVTGTGTRNSREGK